MLKINVDSYRPRILGHIARIRTLHIRPAEQPSLANDGQWFHSARVEDTNSCWSRQWAPTKSPSPFPGRRYTNAARHCVEKEMRSVYRFRLRLTLVQSCCIYSYTKVLTRTSLRPSADINNQLIGAKSTMSCWTHAFIGSRLDYCNGLYYGISDVGLLLSSLQSVQNTAARLITGL
jgi:hypothetical protein